uniref:Uncharacterized protein n=1 Tax=Asparagopsis taxiformis TaxID=260499 RepID=A0A0E3DBI9_9FLOR|nr:hypothetical protein Atax.mt.36 [Asparagopsis taxiformis]AHX02416.1 hypothetical protein Atax.mt.36 [Asparagopsis taxiformis]
MIQKINKLKPGRLETYYNYIGSFDFLDKVIDRNYNEELFVPQIKNFTLYNVISSFSSKKLQVLSLGLFLELLTGSKFLQFYSRKLTFSKTLILRVTFSKQIVLSILDILLNSLFLNRLNVHFLNKSKTSIVVFINKITSNFLFYLNQKFINLFNFSSLNNICWFNLNIHSFCDINLCRFYFIPV